MHKNENKTIQPLATHNINGSNNSVFFQPKLTVNQAGDSYEQEADAMADHVMRMTDPMQASPSFFKPAITGIQRKCQQYEEKDKFVHRKENSNAQADSTNGLDGYVSTLSSSGTTLPQSNRMFFEPHFGHDFSNVRVHTDQAAAQSAQSINALAYTTGNNIVFNAGQYSPDSDSGKKLLAHELTHVVQQNSGKVAKKDAQQTGVIQMAPAQHDKPAATPPAAAPKPAAPVPKPVPAATAAVFSEDTSEKFAGYDASVNPNWLVVPKGEQRIAKVDVTPAGAAPTYVSEDAAKATVTTTATGITVKGVAKGETKINVMQATTKLATLRIAVKEKVSHSVAFFYVCDSAATPHCATKVPAANAMKDMLNNVWQRQSNVAFTGGASSDVKAAGDLGPAVDDDGHAGGEMGTVTALGGGADYNVFRVWKIASPVCDSDCNGGLTGVKSTLLADASCADGLGLPHEAGHFMGLDHDSGFIMDPCPTPRKDKRVSKDMTDKINP